MEELESAYQRTVIIGGALLVSLLAYVAVAWVLELGTDGFDGFAASGLAGDTMKLIRYGLVFVCFVEIALIRWLKGRALSSPEISAEPPRVEELIPRLVSTHILIFGVSESIGILGLVFFLLTGSSFDLYAFVGLSALLLVLSLPRYSQWQEWLSRHSLRARL